MLSIDNLPPAFQVVVVDDEDHNLYVFDDHFGEEFNIITFSTPKDAKKYILQNKRVLVVISDFSMPDINGISLANSITQDSPWINFIMLTANPTNDNELMYKSLKQNLFFDFLKKPIELDNTDVFKQVNNLVISAAKDAYYSFMRIDYDNAVETFERTPILSQDIKQFDTFLKNNYPDVSFSNNTTSFLVYENANDLKKTIAVISKTERGSWECRNEIGSTYLHYNRNLESLLSHVGKSKDFHLSKYFKGFSKT